MFCTKCGTKNVDEALFCDECGSVLKKLKNLQQVNVQSQKNSPPILEQKKNTGSSGSSPKKKQADY